MAHFSVLLLLAALYYVGNSEGRSTYELVDQVGEEATYDKLALVYTWAPSFCKMTSCNIPSTASEIWTIHGLWPFKNYQMNPVFCGMNYDSSVINGALRTTLNQKWPSLKSGVSNDRFWQYEYTKHGSCITDISTLNSQLKYFQGTVNLYDRYDIKGILASRGNHAVQPSQRLRYPLSYITSALRNGIGANPNVYCVSKDARTQYLWEIRVCMDKACNPINCGTSEAGRGKCSPYKTVIYPPFPSHVNTKSLGTSDDLLDQFLFDVAEMGEREMMMNEEEEKENDEEEEEDDDAELWEKLFEDDGDMWEEEDENQDDVY